MRRRFNVKSRIEALTLRSASQDLSQREVAAKLHVSERTVRRWEADARNRRAPPLDEAWDAIVAAWQEARNERVRSRLLAAMTTLAIEQSRQVREDIQIDRIRRGDFPPPPVPADRVPADPPPARFADRFNQPIAPGDEARALGIINAIMAAANSAPPPAANVPPQDPSGE